MEVSKSCGCPENTSKLVCCLDHEEVLRDSNECLKKRTCGSLKSGICNKLAQKEFCACKEGFYRNKCGFCVEAHDCDGNCTVNQIFCRSENETLYGCYDSSVSRLCPGHSKYSLNSNKNNNGLIILNVCDCKHGYYRNICDQCVKLIDCGKKCKKSVCDPCSDPNAFRVEKVRKSDILRCKDNLNRNGNCNCGHCNCEHCNCQYITSEQCNCEYCKSEHTPSKIKQLDFHDEFKEYETFKCICMSGFALNECNQCIPIKQCTNKTPCKCSCPKQSGNSTQYPPPTATSGLVCTEPHEEVLKDGNECLEGRYCIKPEICPFFFADEFCACAYGYLRDKCNICVPKANCNRTSQSFK